MRTYHLTIKDDRYSVPIVKHVMARDHRAVRDAAERVLSESSHHVSVSVALNAVHLFDLGSTDAEAPLRHERTSPGVRPALGA